MVYRSAIAINVSSVDQTLPRASDAILVGTGGNLTVDFSSIKSAEAIVTGINPSTGAITAVKLLYGGFGYLAAPTVVVQSLLGTSAVLTATITSGVVTALAISTPGTGYSIQRPPAISFTGGRSNGSLVVVPAGVIPISASKIYHSGTSALNLVALYI